MGVPKFFRYISERWPLISQLVQDNRIPEFDNLYLDMNGIIHHCSHPNDGDAHFRITEEAIYLGVFTYLEHLFALVRPRKLFFLAVDGVAPRAKMNQQRSRRFRTAKESKDLVEKAVRRGEALPETEGFDSNCITPGTPFMTRLSEQLKYFINKKVSEDAAWRDVRVILSGHEVPGEGEHKIMEYIRLAKAQPDYDPNVRHCLYGLDADLIMLALLSHDPHFCLLREEVSFGPKRSKPKGGLESQTFYLLHVSLVREYLDLEFGSLKDDAAQLPFVYDLERIIDDFILLCVFVGNDFLPHLPGIHINEGAFPLLFEIYKRVLPRAGGYLNDHGTLDLARLQLVLDELHGFEKNAFEHEFADSSWFKGRQQKHVLASEKARSQASLVLTQEQRALFERVKTFALSGLGTPALPSAGLVIPATLRARDRTFLRTLATDLGLCIAFDTYSDSGKPTITISLDATLLDGSDGDDSDGDDSVARATEAESALRRVLRKYDSAPTEAVLSEEDVERAHARKVAEKLDEWKADYYREKLSVDFRANHDSVRRIATAYVAGLQWVLHYYYDGVASWGWFYPYHYAPKISDLAEVAGYEIRFDLGEPFRPFEQLMGVLPSLSSAHVPPAFRDLMSDPDSPIIDFYPTNFDTDLNGKKQDWEAVVKIPFIDEKRLLLAMRGRESRLTADEKRRNEFGVSWAVSYDGAHEATFPSSLPGFFPDLHYCHAKMIPYDLPTLGGLRLVKGLCEGVLLGKDAIAGFPSLQNLPYTGQLAHHGVNIFQSDSRNETVVVSIENVYDDVATEELARAMIGNRVFAGYPYLQEAHVVAVSDSLFRYQSDPAYGVRSSPHRPDEVAHWRRAADRLEHVYSKRYGVLIQQVDVILHVRLLAGLKRNEDGALVKDYDDKETDLALQTVVRSVSSEDSRFKEQGAMSLSEEFPENTKVFFLGPQQYGTPAQVVGHQGNGLIIRIVVRRTVSLRAKDRVLTPCAQYFAGDKGENFAFRGAVGAAAPAGYLPSHAVSRRLRISGLTLSKITSSLMIAHDSTKLNLGLNLKFEAKSQKVLGYTRRTENGWEFSERAIQLIAEYKDTFPEIVDRLTSRSGEDLTQARDFFPVDTAARVAAAKQWIQDKGVRDFEKVSIYAEALVGATIARLEEIAAQMVTQRTASSMKQAVIRGIPRKAVLKPSHATSRLAGQTFQLGDRVVTVSDSGTVPLSGKGTVVGDTGGLVEVVFDVPFIGGTTLSDRCSPYKGQAVEPTTLLNLTTPQFTQVVGRPEAPQGQRGRFGATRARPSGPFARGRGAAPALVPQQGTDGALFFRPAPAAQRATVAAPGVQILRPAQPFSGDYRGAIRGGPAPGPRQTQRQRLEAALAGPQRPAGTHAANGTARGSSSAYNRMPPPPSLASPNPQPRGRRPGRGRGRGQPHQAVNA